MPTFTLISSVTGGAVTLTFNSIPQTYKDLVIIGSGASNFNADVAGCALRVNGSSASIYTYITNQADNSSYTYSASAGNDAIYFPMLAVNSTTTHSTAIIQLVDYANTSRQKNCIIRSGAPMISTITGNETVVTGNINTTAAISSISLLGSSGVAWTSTTRFDLYGLAAS
jgi:hypothetical protein